MTMIESLKNVAGNAYALMPKLRIDTPSNIMKKAQKIALPAIALAGAAYVQAAEGGPISFVACVGGCYAAIAINPFFILHLPTCMMACEILGAAPIP